MSYTCLTHNSDDGDENNSGYDIVNSLKSAVQIILQVYITFICK